MLKAVIFDLDGTLVDLLDLHFQGFRQVIKEGWDLEIKLEDVERYYGKTAEEIAKPFFESHGVKDVDYKEFGRKRRQVVIDKLHAGYKVKILPGVFEILGQLKSAGVKTALATSNNRETGEAILESARLKGYFQAVVYREDVKNGKPAPDMFLRAAKLLGVKPEECAVVEDSVYGLQAGKAAGMKVIAVETGTQPRKELLACNPHLLVETIEHLSLEDIKD